MTEIIDFKQAGIDAAKNKIANEEYYNNANEIFDKLFPNIKLKTIGDERWSDFFLSYTRTLQKENQSLCEPKFLEFKEKFDKLMQEFPEVELQTTDGYSSIVAVIRIKGAGYDFDI